MKNASWLIVIVAFIALAGAIVFFNSGSTPETVQQGTGETQKITLGMRNLNYYPNTITVKSNQPVELTLE